MKNPIEGCIPGLEGTTRSRECRGKSGATVRGKFIDLTGKKFGRWTVLERGENTVRGVLRWICECECGQKSIVEGGSLKKGKTLSCGCYQLEVVTRHGMNKAPEYKAWRDMIQRCYNQNNERYKDWGGRGITVCERWRHSFEDFYEDMGNKTTLKHSLDRIKNNGNYEPGNCKWSTSKEQMSNQRKRKSRMKVSAT